MRVSAGEDVEVTPAGQVTQTQAMIGELLGEIRGRRDAILSQGGLDENMLARAVRNGFLMVQQ
jgi:hypothetical protein